MRASSWPMPKEAPVIRAIGCDEGIRFSVETQLAAPRGYFLRKKAGPETRLNVGEAARLDSSQRGLGLVNRVPRSRGLQLVVDVVDVLQPFRLKPGTKCGCALLG